MVALIIVLAVVGGAIGWAAWYDAKQRRRGVRVRPGGAMANEALHHRVDIDAVPYEPARQAGQRDWATYRARDRKRRD
jgi:hypothetical protein